MGLQAIFLCIILLLTHTRFPPLNSRTPDSPLKRASYNHQFYSHFLLFSTTTYFNAIVQMPRVKRANTKALRKASEKAQNIQLAVKAYKKPISNLLLPAAASQALQLVKE